MSASTEKELARAVWEWWLTHRYDTVGSWNIYDERPEFVTLAEALLSEPEMKELEKVHFDNL